MSTTVLNPRTAKITLWQGDDEDQIRELANAAHEARQRAEKAGPRGLGDEPEWMTLAQEHDEFVAAAKERAVHVVVRAVGRKTWKQLVNGNPPREGNDNDEAAGVNEDDFAEVLVPLSVASPIFESDAKRDEFLDSLNDNQFTRIYMTAFALNRGGQADPKADLLLQLTPTSTET